MRSRRGKTWSVFDDSQAAFMVLAGCSLLSIAVKLRRSERAVAYRLHREIMPRSEWAQDRIERFLKTIDPEIYDYNLNRSFQLRSWDYKFK